MDVLVDLDEEEGHPQQPGHHQSELQSVVVVVPDRLERVVNGEARGDQDDGVYPSYQDRELDPDRRPGIGADDDPEEEVGREEAREQHHLREDEEEDPEDRLVDPGALVRLGRSVVVILGWGCVTGGGDAGALHQTSTPASSPSPAATAATTVSPARPASWWETGLSVNSRTRPIRSSFSHWDSSPGRVEIRMSSTW